MENKSFKTKLKSFSEDVFRNYLIVRARWELYNLERQHGNEIRNLGNRIYRQYRRDHIPIPEVEPILKSLTDLDGKIEHLEDRLRDLIMNADLPKQIPSETSPISGSPVSTPVADSAPVSLSIETTPPKDASHSSSEQPDQTIGSPPIDLPQPSEAIEQNSAFKSVPDEIQELRSLEDTLSKDSAMPKKAKKQN